MDAFINVTGLGPDPTLDSRAEGSPVGLKVGVYASSHKRVPN